MGQITVKVSLLGEIRRPAGRRDLEISLPEGSTVQELLDHLSQRLGDGFTRQVFSQEGTLYRHVSIFVNGSDLKDVGGLGARLVGGEIDVLILPTYGGG